MSAPDREASSSDEQRPPERVGDALRSAVERTLAASAGSATQTQQRARELVDELVRRGELAREEVTRRGGAAAEGVARRGGAARDQVTRTRQAARQDLARRGEEASGRLAEALAELKLGDREDLGPLGERLATVERRLAEIERELRRERLEKDESGGLSNPKPEPESSAEGADSGG